MTEAIVKPTVFLDRDGVINRKLPGDYVKSWREFEFLPGSIEALRKLKQHGFRLIVVTNQQGVALRKLLEDDLRAIHERMTTELRNAGAGLDGIYYCPHAAYSCHCRKPETGLFLKAQGDFPGIEFSNSFMIGDSASDMEAAERLGLKKVLIGYEAAKVRAALTAKNIRVDISAKSFLAAVNEHFIKPDETTTAAQAT